jgi:glycosyltransferase involved in cell wall biosynthesis
MKTLEIDNCPCVDVVIPVHNGQEFLEEAINSVVNQQHLNQILIILNNCEDNSENIARKMQKDYLNIQILDQPLVGISNALNLGISKSTAEYIARLDSDDIMFPNRLAIQVAHMREKRAISVLGTQVEYIDFAGTILGISKYPSGNNLRKERFGIFNPIAHPSVIIRSEVFKKVGLYNSEFDGAEDLDLWLRVIIKNVIANLPIPLTFYRKHPNQVSLGDRTRFSEIATRRAFGENFDFLNIDSISLFIANQVRLKMMEHSAFYFLLRTFYRKLRSVN